VRCESAWSDTNGGRDYLKACPCSRERREFVGVASRHNPFFFFIKPAVHIRNVSLLIIVKSYKKRTRSIFFDLLFPFSSQLQFLPSSNMTYYKWSYVVEIKPASGGGEVLLPVFPSRIDLYEVSGFHSNRDKPRCSVKQRGNLSVLSRPVWLLLENFGIWEMKFCNKCYVWTIMNKF